MKDEVLFSHEQKYEHSCIPMAVELVLKLLGRVEYDFYELQHECGNRKDVGFAEFDGRTIAGVTFKHEFTFQRGPVFPLSNLFQRIEELLSQGQFVSISLPSKVGYHMAVIHQIQNDEFVAASVASPPCGDVLNYPQVKAMVRQVSGTDILTYVES